MTSPTTAILVWASNPLLLMPVPESWGSAHSGHSPPDEKTVQAGSSKTPPAKSGFAGVIGHDAGPSAETPRGRAARPLFTFRHSFRISYCANDKWHRRGPIMAAIVGGSRDLSALSQHCCFRLAFYHSPRVNNRTPSLLKIGFPSSKLHPNSELRLNCPESTPLPPRPDSPCFQQPTDYRPGP